MSDAKSETHNSYNVRIGQSFQTMKLVNSFSFPCWIEFLLRLKSCGKRIGGVNGHKSHDMALEVRRKECMSLKTHTHTQNKISLAPTRTNWSALQRLCCLFSTFSLHFDSLFPFGWPKTKMKCQLSNWGNASDLVMAVLIMRFDLKLCRRNNKTTTPLTTGCNQRRMHDGNVHRNNDTSCCVQFGFFRAEEYKMILWPLTIYISKIKRKKKREHSNRIESIRLFNGFNEKTIKKNNNQSKMPMVYEKFVDHLGDRMHAFTQYQPLAQT